MAGVGPGAKGGARRSGLVRVCDLAGRPRGTGFLADAHGTLVTSHEAVDGLARLVLHAPGEQVCLVEAEAVTAFPELGLALVATEGLDLTPLPLAPPGPVPAGRRVLLPLPRPLTGSVTRTAGATYTATDRFHLLDTVHALALDPPPRAAAGGPEAAPDSGAPVTDTATGAVLGIVVTALHTGFRAGALSVPLHARDAPRALADLLARNAATVPAYGDHLNLAGALRLTGATGRAPAVAARVPAHGREPIARAHVAEALRDFLASSALAGPSTPSGPGVQEGPLVLGLVGEPGTGRSTQLAALAAHNADGTRPVPTVRLRGAELRPGDGSLADAVARALRDGARVVAAGGGAPGREPPVPDHGDPAGALAAVARAAGRPLAVLLDAPEEMPPVLAHDLPGWAARSATWLRATGTRLVVACRPELWEQLGALLPPSLLAAGPAEPPAAALRPLPPCLRLGGLRAGEAAVARARHGLPDRVLSPADAQHPLTLRLLAEVRGAYPAGREPEPGTPPPSRAEVFAAYLDLMSLRIAEHVAAAASPPVRGTGVRRLAARAAGRVHTAARRCLGPGQGELDREGFEELFPWRTGWAAAVLTEGLLVPAGAGYRFAHEEFGEWLQSLHLDLSGALHALVHRWVPAPGRALGPAGEAPVRLPSRAAVRGGRPPAVPPPPHSPLPPTRARSPFRGTVPGPSSARCSPRPRTFWQCTCAGCWKPWTHLTHLTHPASSAFLAPSTHPAYEPRLRGHDPPRVRANPGTRRPRPDGRSPEPRRVRRPGRPTR
ncbi:trypsin-like peptidase domain-containing protein [Actinacidiphila yeochonensis]|uniref:trypsin-like peptidase domain-containing protein n=1 Tax=Actinacidiphila yeochonensis TaxID=89050 RepID=UPI0012FF0CE0|nr:trypsin-like peptidase domain-containing protein [Actinacidiphila yeochonensis]